MDPLVLVGALITVITFASGFPQPVRVWRLRNVEGLSPSTHALSWCLCTTWIVYGILRGDATQIIANALGVVGLAAVAVAMFAFGLRSKMLRVMTWVGVYFAVLIPTALLIGVVPVVIVGSALSMTFKLPQAVLAWRAPGGAGVSATAFLLSGVGNSLWFAHGFLAHDLAVVATSCWGLSVNVFIASRTLMARVPERRMALAEI